MTAKIKSLIWRLRYLDFDKESRMEAAKELEKMASLVSEFDSLVQIDMACPHCGKFATSKLEMGQ
jgi:hypothetical protein